MRRGEPDADYQEKLKQAMAEKAEDLIDKFQEEWNETMQNMAEAEDAFEDLDGEACLPHAASAALATSQPACSLASGDDTGLHVLTTNPVWEHCSGCGVGPANGRAAAKALKLRCRRSAGQRRQGL